MSPVWRKYIVVITKFQLYVFLNHTVSYVVNFINFINITVNVLYRSSPVWRKYIVVITKELYVL